MVQCFVHNCPTGLKSCKDKVSVFRVPNDERMLQKWRENVPQKFRPLMSSDKICEKHFESHYVVPRYVQIKGDYYKDCIRPKLSPRAVPTIFPDYDKQSQSKVLVQKKLLSTLTKAPIIAPKLSTLTKAPMIAPKLTKPSIINPAVPAFTKTSMITPKEPESLASLMAKEMANGIEVGEHDYVPVCFSCLMDNCSSHATIVD